MRATAGLQGWLSNRAWDLPDLQARTLHLRPPESFRNVLLRRRESLPTARPRRRLPHRLRPDRNIRRNRGKRRDNRNRYDSHLHPVHDKPIPVPALLYPVMDNLLLRRVGSDRRSNSCDCTRPRREEAKTIVPKVAQKTYQTPHLIMRRSFFFGNHNGIGPEERESIADSIINCLKVASNK